MPPFKQESRLKKRGSISLHKDQRIKSDKNLLLTCFDTSYHLRQKPQLNVVRTSNNKRPEAEKTHSAFVYCAQLYISLKDYYQLQISHAYIRK